MQIISKEDIARTVLERLRDGTGRAGQSFGTDFQCQYTDRSGKHCAAGLFIPEGHEAHDFLGAWENVVATFPELSFGEELDHFIKQWQLIHDDKRHWDDNYFNALGEATVEHFLRAHEVTL